MPQCKTIAGALKQTFPQMNPQKNPRGIPYFTGAVAIDPLHTHQPSHDIIADFPASVSMVTFTPGAHTYWHWHERGQLLTVTKGSGWVCDRGGEPKRLKEGDVVWCPPDTTHWHGADDGSEMMHIAFSMGGVKWLEAVNDQEYAAKDKA